MNTNNEYNVFTKDENGVNIAVNNLDVSCITNPNNKFAIDSEGNITANSITLVNSSNNPISYDEIFDRIYPVGSIYLSVNNTNPSQIFGGTWKQIAKGRTLVGVDPYDTDFNEVKKTGGSKFLQAHSHTLKGNTNVGSSKNCGYWNLPSLIEGYNYGETKDIFHYNTFTTDTGRGNSENLQPYYTCYIWARIA